MARSSRRKPSRSAPVYRRVEQLLFWIEPLVDRFPKALSFQERGRKILYDLHESLDLIALGLQAKAGTERLTYIRALHIRMTDVKTHVRCIRERSKNPSERCIAEPDPEHPAPVQRLMTDRQYQTFITFMLGIDFEISSWEGGNIPISADQEAAHPDKTD